MMREVLTDEMQCVAEKFQSFVFEIPATEHRIPYNLFIPEHMEKGEKYPLVLFLHDLSACSQEATATLNQGVGALVWAGKEAQEKHPCFVLAPQYGEKAANDDFEVGWEAEATIELVKMLLTKYEIDENRIYGTGQSMGSMMLCEMNVRYPDFFGGCFLVAGQWNPQTMAAIKNTNTWVLVSAKDGKAFPVMQACMAQIEKAGGRVTRGGIDGNAPLEIQNAQVRYLIGNGTNLFFTWFEGDTVLPEELQQDTSGLNGGIYHVMTWRKAYYITAIHDWLFTQSRKKIDFSCKHDIMIENGDGTLCPMDEPYFRAKLVMPGTWQIESSGDYCYLVEGSEQAVLIDTGYGCGNIRSFAQSLTKKPVKYAVNTHDHFDHTAGNGYFEAVYMSAETAELATLPFPSFAGIEFPRDYQKRIVEEGDVISLGGRDLLVFKTPDHAVGSILLLDSRDGILFCGDEMTMPFGKPVTGYVETFRRYLQRVQAYRDKIRLICGGPGIADAGLIDRLAENMDYILAGHEGQIMEPETGNMAASEDKASEAERTVGAADAAETAEADKADGGTVIYDRRMPHGPDRHWDDPAELEYKRKMLHAGTCVIYDVRKVRELSSET